uniref:Uncharacterized protein n=1 Tax=Sphaerodactylus townsendi TaxID=933632 RepID=A0ACB8ETM4_9SAUR
MDPQTTPAERGFEAANVSAWQEVDERLRSTIQTLQKNMEEVVRRLSRLESLASLQEPSHPPAHLTPPTLLFLLAWPLIVQWLLGRFQSWKR